MFKKLLIPALIAVLAWQAATPAQIVARAGAAVLGHRAAVVAVVVATAVVTAVVATVVVAPMVVVVTTLHIVTAIAVVTAAILAAVLGYGNARDAGGNQCWNEGFA